MIDKLESSHGWLIHQYPVRDNLLLLYILTEQGYLKGFYRVPKNKVISQKPTSFAPYWVSWKRNKQAINIQTLEFVSSPYWLKNLKLIVGLYLNELIFNLCKSEDFELNAYVYQLYQAIIQDENDCPLLLIRQFEWQLLADCGYAIDFNCTADQKPIEAHLRYQFSPDLGFFESVDGWPGATIQKIADSIWDTEELNILKIIFRNTIDYVLDGKLLQSRELLKNWIQEHQKSD
jgi:recombinational DNA repair protein (RecF pathway)